MKNVIISMVLLLSSIITNAQNDSTLITPKSTWQIGILAGPNYQYANRFLNKEVGYFIGALGAKKIKKIKVESGFLFTQVAYNYWLGGSNYKTILRAQSLSIPVKCNYYLIKKQYSLYLTSAILFVVPLRLKAITKDNGVTLSRTIILSKTKLFYSAILGLGYDYKLNNKYDFSIQTFVEKGISKENNGFSFFNITLGINRNL